MLALESLSLYCVPIASCCFTQKNTPQLRSLSCSNSSSFRRFDLDLPHLESINMEYTQVSRLQFSTLLPDIAVESPAAANSLV
jgi:hypothetical protein